MTAAQTLGCVCWFGLMLATAIIDTAGATGIGARLPVEYRAWTLEDAGGGKIDVQQTYIPLVATLTARAGTKVVLSGAAGSSTLDGAESIDLNALADAKVQIYHQLLGRSLLLIGGVNLPTGARELSDDELALVRALGHPLLGMRLKHYGRGFDWNGGLASAFPIGRAFELGLAGGYLHTGEYVLTEGGASYRPGTEASASVALALGRRENRVELRGTYRSYGKDALDDKTLFEEGNEIELGISAEAQWGRVRFETHAIGIDKEDNVSYTRSLTGPFVEALQQRPGRGLSSRAGATFVGSSRWECGVTSEWTHFEDSESDTENGDAYGVGPALALRLGAESWVRIEALLLAGSAGEGQEALDLNGFSALVGILWRR